MELLIHCDYCETYEIVKPIAVQRSVHKERIHIIAGAKELP